MVTVPIAGNILGEATTPSGNSFNEATRGHLPIANISAFDASCTSAG